MINQAAHAAAVQNMMRGFSTLGAGLGTAGRYFRPDVVAEREKRIAEDKRKKAAEEAGLTEDEALHPLTMRGIGKMTEAQDELDAEGLPKPVPRPEDPDLGMAGGMGSLLGPVAGDAAGGAPPPPPMPPPGALPAGAPGATRGMLGPGTLAGLRQMGPIGFPPPPPARATPFGPVGMPPAGGGGPPGLPPPPLPAGGAPTLGASMGKAPVPAIRSLPGSGDFSASRRRTQKELQAAKLMAFTGRNPALSGRLSQESLSLATLEDPDAAARDNMRIAKALQGGGDLSGIETELETRAGKEALAGMMTGLHGEGRKTAAAAAAQRQKHRDEVEIERMKLEGKRTKDDDLNADLALLMELGDDEEAIRGASFKDPRAYIRAIQRIKDIRVGSGKLDEGAGKAVDRALKLSDNSAQRAKEIRDVIMDRVKLKYPDDMARLDDQAGYEAAVAEAEREIERRARPFLDAAVKYAEQAERIAEGIGAAAPAPGGGAAPPAPAPGAPAAPPAPAPAPGKPPEGTKATSADALIDQMADLDPASEEYGRLKAQYQELYGGTQTKAAVVPPAPGAREQPSAGGMAPTPAEGRKTAGERYYLQKELTQRGLDDASRKKKYAAILAGSDPKYANMTEEQRETAARQEYDADEKAAAAILGRPAKMREADEAAKRKAGEGERAREEREKKAAAERKARLGPVSGFMGQ